MEHGQQAIDAEVSPKTRRSGTARAAVCTTRSTSALPPALPSSPMKSPTSGNGTGTRTGARCDQSDGHPRPRAVTIDRLGRGLGVSPS